jgi:hypothetical protein
MVQATNPTLYHTARRLETLKTQNISKNLRRRTTKQ